MDAGFPAVTRFSVVGRAKQRKIKIGQITYDEIPKETILMVVKDSDKDYVVETVMKVAPEPATKGLSATAKFSSTRFLKCTPSARASRKWPAERLKR